MEGLGNYAKKLFFTVVVGLLLLLIYHGIKMLLLLFAGILLAILWRGVSRWIHQRTGVPFRVCLPFVVLINIGSVVLFFFLAYPSIAEQGERFVAEIPNASGEIKKNISKTDVGKIVVEAIEEKRNGLEKLSGQMDRLISVFSDTLGVIIDTLLVFVFALFLVSGPGLYVKGLIQLAPKTRRKRFMEVILETKTTLFRWFIGKILDMSSIFILTLTGLWILDMPLAFTFALIAFLFSFVPNIGPIISVIPPLAIAVLEGPNMPLYVGLLYLGIQLFESYFITPSIQQHASYVPPVLLLLVQFLFAAFMGVLGLLLATPLLVGLMVTTRMLYVEDYLEKESDSH